MERVPSAAFASDNAAPAHPAVMEALTRMNQGPAPAYGTDPVTAQARDTLRAAFDSPDAEVLFAFTGTAANIIALASAVRPWQEIFCSDMAHVLVDEAGGAVRLSGAQLTRLPSDDGLIEVAVAIPVLRRRWLRDAEARIEIRRARGRAMSITPHVDVVRSVDDGVVGPITRKRSWWTEPGAWATYL